MHLIFKNISKVPWVCSEGYLNDQWNGSKLAPLSHVILHYSVLYHVMPCCNILCLGFLTMLCHIKKWSGELCGWRVLTIQALDPWRGTYAAQTEMEAEGLSLPWALTVLHLVLYLLATCFYSLNAQVEMSRTHFKVEVVSGRGIGRRIHIECRTGWLSHWLRRDAHSR